MHFYNLCFFQLNKEKLLSNAYIICRYSMFYFKCINASRVFRATLFKYESALLDTYSFVNPSPNFKPAYRTAVFHLCKL